MSLLASRWSCLPPSPPLGPSLPRSGCSVFLAPGIFRALLPQTRQSSSVSMHLRPPSRRPLLARNLSLFPGAGRCFLSSPSNTGMWTLASQHSRQPQNSSSNAGISAARPRRRWYAAQEPNLDGETPPSSSSSGDQREQSTASDSAGAAQDVDHFGVRDFVSLLIISACFVAVITYCTNHPSPLETADANSVFGCSE
jgi:hypothetical protein